MKHIIIIILTCLVSGTLYPQQQKIPYMNAQDLAGVFKAGHKAVSLSFSEYRAYDNKDLHILQVLGEARPVKQVLAITHGCRLVDIISNEKTAVVLFEDASNELLEMVVLDENGKAGEVKTRQTSNTDLESFSQLSRWVISENNVLYLVRSYSQYEEPKPKVRNLVNEGYELLSMDMDAKLLGNYRQSGKGLPYTDIKTVIPHNEGCILFTSSNEQRKKTFSAQLQLFSKTAALTGTYPLSGVDFTYYPTDMIVHNGEIVASGMYFKGLWHNAKTSEGLFMLRLNNKGEKTALSLQPWADIKSKIGTSDKSDFMFNGKTDFLVEAINPTPDGYIIIGESYAKSSGVSTVEFIMDTEDNSDSRVLTIYDFIIIETDKNGLLTSVRKLGKENSNIQINGGMAMLRNVELSFMLKKFNKFPFQAYKNNEIHYISYKNKEGSYSVMDAKTGAIKSSKPIKIEPEIIIEVNPAERELIDNSKTLSKLERLSNKMDAMDKKLEAAGNKMDYAINKTDVVFSPGQKETSGIVMLGNGSSVNYLVHPETQTLYYLVY